MADIREKRLAFKHSQLYKLQAKQESKFFLHPKVQMVWIERAAQLGVQAVLVGLLLHFKVVLSKADEVTLPQNLLDRFQLSRGVKRRALGKLEQAGLISIVRRTGRSSLIKLLRV